MTSGPAVSIITVTHNSAAVLPSLVQGLDAQSLPLSEFEVVIVDRGSTDGSTRRLRQLAGRRTNVRLVEVDAEMPIGKAFNRAAAAAAGRYILPLPATDQIYPETAERLVRFADDHRLDAVVCRGLGPARPGVNALLLTGTTALLLPVDRLAALLSPFRMYRREMLAAAGIAYPDGEFPMDRTVQARVATATASVGVYADYPCARGVGLEEAYPLTDDGTDVTLWWRDVEEALAVLEQASDPEQAAVFIASQAVAASHYLNLEGHPELAEPLLAALQVHCPPERDLLLAPNLRGPVRLLRQRSLGEAAALGRSLRGIKLQADAPELRWQQGRLEISVTGRAMSRTGSALLGDGETAGSYATDAGSADAAELVAAATVVLGIRNRLTGPVYVLPGKGSCRIEAAAAEKGPATVVFDCTAEFDLTQVGAGKPLEPGTWQVVANLIGLGIDATPVLPLTAVPDVPPALVDGQYVVPCGLNGNTLHLDVGAVRVSALRRLRPEDCTIDDGASGVLLTMAVPDLCGWPHAVRHGQLVVGDLPLPATLEADEHGTTIRCRVSGLAGSYPLATVLGPGKPVPTGLALEIAHIGTMTVQKVLRPRPAATGATGAGASASSAGEPPNGVDPQPSGAAGVQRQLHHALVWGRQHAPSAIQPAVKMARSTRAVRWVARKLRAN